MAFGGPGEGPWGDDVANAPLEPHMGMRTLGAALGASFLSTLAQAEGSRGARRGLHMMQGVLVTVRVTHGAASDSESNTAFSPSGAF